MKIQKTSFHPAAIKEMGFKMFQELYSSVLRGDLKAHFEAITGEKVKKSRTNKDSE